MSEILQITFKGMEPSPAVEARVQRKIKALEHLFGHIIRWRVVVERQTHRHQKGDLFQIGIEMSVPGAEIVVNRCRPLDRSHEDVHVAVRDAFDAARRRLQDWQRAVRTEVKRHEAPSYGRVKQLFPNLDYGVIQTPDAREIYFHKNAALDRFDSIQIGDEVRFELHEPDGEDGAHASSVKRVGKHHPVAPPL